METGIHGVPRAREWDVVVGADSDGVDGDHARFVVLAGGAVVVEEGGRVEQLAVVLADSLDPPFRADATRRGERRWTVGIRAINVLTLAEDPGGDDATLAVHEGERTLTVDGAPTVGTIAELEQWGARLGRSYVVQARRLGDNGWEVEAMPL